MFGTVVAAAEVFSPMVAIANEAILHNGLGHAVTVVPKRSTDMAVPADMPRRADVVVSEILDTELIGEGACVPILILTPTAGTLPLICNRG